MFNLEKKKIKRSGNYYNLIPKRRWYYVFTFWLFQRYMISLFVFDESSVTVDCSVVVFLVSDGQLLSYSKIENYFNINYDIGVKLETKINLCFCSFIFENLIHKSISKNF